MLNPLLHQIEEDVMGFLNEIQLQYPEAITFASGRPAEQFFTIRDFPEYVASFVDYLSEKTGKDKTEIWNTLGQYNRAKGIVNELVAQYLGTDEGIYTDPEAIVMTVGTQEAMIITVMTLCDRDNDVILVEDPTYIGITHFAKLSGYRIAAVPVDDYGISPGQLEQAILEQREQGRNVKLVYVIPDFQNPTGISMPAERRKVLLDLADQYDFFILEDNAYGEFRYNGAKVLPMKAMDRNKRVIYMRSFSKTIYPSLRLGALVADQVIMDKGIPVALSDLMAKVKGYTTVNTSSICQAIFGGILIRNDCSLVTLNKGKIADLRQKLNFLLDALNTYVGSRQELWESPITWNIPEGGFFLKLNLPFKVDKEEVMKCVSQFGVIITPMSFFYLEYAAVKEIRLAFSNVDEKQITAGIERLSRYFESKSNLKTI